MRKQSKEDYSYQLPASNIKTSRTAAAAASTAIVIATVISHLVFSSTRHYYYDSNHNNHPPHPLQNRTPGMDKLFLPLFPFTYHSLSCLSLPPLPPPLSLYPPIGFASLRAWCCNHHSIVPTFIITAIRTIPSMPTSNHNFCVMTARTGRFCHPDFYFMLFPSSYHQSSSSSF